MPERILEVRVFELRYACDVVACTGSMMHTGRARQGISGPELQHVCSKCKTVGYLKTVYPSTMGLPINEEIPKEWHDKLVPGAINNPPAPPGKIQLA